MMVLQKQTIRVPFGPGVETKADPKVIQGKLLALENGVFHRPGSIKKRNGFDTPYSLVTLDKRAGTWPEKIRNGKSIYSRGYEILVTAEQTSEDTAGLYRVAWEDGYAMFTRDDQRDRWKKIGTREPVSLSVTNVVEPTALWVIPDVALAETNKYAGYVWLGLKDPAATHYALAGQRWGHLCIVDLSLNSKIIDDHRFDAPPLHNIDTKGIHITGIDAAANRFYVWIATPTTNSVYLSMVNTALPTTVGATSQKIADLHNDMLWDVTTATHSVHGRCTVVAYKESAGGEIYVRWFNSSGTLVHSQLIADACKGAICVFEAYDWQTASYKTMVGYQRNANGHIYYQSYNADGTAYTGGSVIARDVGIVYNMTGCRDASADVPLPLRSYMRFYIEVYDLATGLVQFAYHAVLQAVIEFDSGNALELRRMYNCCLASKAWDYGDKPRVWVVHDSWAVLTTEGPDRTIYNTPRQNTYFLRSPQGGGTGQQDERDRTDARALGGEAGGKSYSQSLSAVVSPETDVYLFAGLRSDVIIDPATTGESYDSVIGLSTSFGKVAQPGAMLGLTLNTGGGYVGLADGRFQELGFHLYPECLVADVTASGASPVAGHWMYCATYEWTDREGQIHVSAPSQPIEVTAVHDDDVVSIILSCLHQGDPAKLDETRIVLYRTTNGPGPVYYRLLSSATHRLNLSTAPYLYMTDNLGGGGGALPDTTLTQYATLYTTGDVIEHICPPATQIMNVFQDRIMLVPDEDPTCIWYSKTKRPEQGVAFSDVLTKRIEDGGRITALAAMDTREIVFKENEIRAFGGSGPNDLGLGEFGADYLVTSDVGCVDRGSVVMTDKGVMFKSHKGIYMLTRSLQVVYIGAPVEAYNYYTVLDAQLVETKNQVRFLLSGSHMLVYDYLMDQWSVFRPGTGLWGAVDSAMWQNTYVMIKSDADVYVENAIYTDDLTWIKLLLDTEWIKVNGIQGFQRVRWASFIGDVYGDAQLTFDIYYNYVEIVHQTVTFPSILMIGATPPAQVRLRPRLQKCQAIRFRIQDAEVPGYIGTAEGFSLTDLQLEIGVKGPGVMRQPALKSH